MKKFLSSLSSTLQEGLRGGLLILALMTTTCLWAYDFQSGDLYYRITSYSAPYTVEVTYELRWSYDNYSGLTTATIPETVTYNGTTYSVTSIVACAFWGCSSLSSITIPNSVTSIGNDAFSACSALTSIVVESDNTAYDSRNNCNAIIETATNTLITGCKNTVIPNSVTSIGFAAFSGCSSLSSITIPNSVTSIWDYAFYDCSSLSSITIPNSVTSIGDYAFSGCSSLTSIVVESDNTAYDSRDNCNAIIETATNTLITGCKNTVIPNSVTSIGNDAFSACSALTSITIPEGVTCIGNGAFYGCSSLTSITIPNSVTSIGWAAFSGCSSLTSVTIGNSVTSIGDGAFSDCSSLSSIILTATTPPTIGGYLCDKTKTIIYIPDNTLSDYEAAWGNDYNFITNENSLTLHVETPGTLSDLIFDAGTRPVLVGKLTLTGTLNDDDFTCMRETMTSLVDIDLSGISNTSGVNFNGKGELIKLLLPDNLTSIGHDAFSDCSSLTSITIPNSVTSIGDWAFYACSSLSVIICKAETPASLGSSVFDGVSKSIPVYVPCSCIDSYRSSDWSCFYNIQEPLAEYSIDISTQNSQMGTTQVDKNTICGNSISATANYGYHFVQWSDGNTDNPRSLELTQDTVLTAEFAPNNYTISTQSSDTERGVTYGDTTVAYLNHVTILATANYGYHFSRWNDGNRDNPRQVQVTEDKTYTAYFDKNTYSITKHYNSEQGYVSGSSSGEYLDNITLTAEPNYGYHFARWSDGVTDNPRTFILTQDTTFTAEFAQTFSGQCGDNLYWSYQNSTLTISGFGEMYDNRPWGLFTNEIQNVILPNGITHIGDDAFNDCTELSEITIPYTVISIGDYAFAGCRKLVHVNCYATNPPIAETTSFANYNVYLKVPCDNLQDYQLDMVFGSFKYIQCIGSEEVEGTDDVVIDAGSTTVTITWPTEEDADSYTIVIMKDGEVVCTLTFNSDGQLLNIAFMPGREGNNRNTQFAEAVSHGTGTGFRFTVTGLEEGTDYDYTITAKDEADNTVATHTGEFKTNALTAVDNIGADAAKSVEKLLRNGQLLILRDGKTYNMMGAEIQ